MNNQNRQIPEPIPPASDITRQRRRLRRSSNRLFKQLRKWFRWQVVIITFLGMVVVTTITLSVLVVDATSQLENSWQSLSRVLTTINNQGGTELTLNDFNRLHSSLYELNRRIASTRSRIRYISPLVNLNRDWVASVESLNVAQELVSAAGDMLVGLQPTLDFMMQGEDEEAVAARISSGERVVELLELGQGQFVNAQARLGAANTQLENIDLTNVSADLLLQIEQMRDYHTQLIGLNTLLLNSSNVLTTVLGLDDDRTYLVLAQNNDEIRPSGGYISTYGWFTVSGGRIMEFDYNPTTTLSPNPPPASFEETFTIPSWWIHYNQPLYAAWDGSWYADFPSTARMAMDYYNDGRNPNAPVDGVLAIDITGFQLILGALGEVPVTSYNTVVSAENFRELVYDIRAFGEGEDPHKRFVAAIYAAIFTEWRNINQERTPDLLGALLEGVQSRHVMIYFADESINEALAATGLNGTQLPPLNYDYLMIVDANLGNKSNSSIVRSLTYDVSIQEDGRLNSRLSSRYDYFASVAENDPAVDAEFHGALDYYNLMQVFVPLGATLTDTNNMDVGYVVSQATHTLFVTRTQVNYDTGERFQFVYEVPPIIETIGAYQRYRLLIQKQAGAYPQDTNIQIALPGNAVIISSTPAADASYYLEQPILDFRLLLDGDQWIEVIYQLPQSSD
jgi:hypothetical protein